ncbi:MAG: hypothetical protein KID00_01375 [Clostridium argentinense]|uniref:Uncharacterized protein n=1 Tax=Clostridium faecium TaxID=2762223 RepID=A0ABR8YVM1_9CLOT|nr:hypothetical protein [Clostridium faecium]MBD8047904.1 hypothetical protein [Clostridium faecium]MBS5822506.1 hypothetical protein [Clostridium argentinense]
MGFFKNIFKKNENINDNDYVINFKNGAKLIWGEDGIEILEKSNKIIIPLEEISKSFVKNKEGVSFELYEKDSQNCTLIIYRNPENIYLQYDNKSYSYPNTTFMALKDRVEKLRGEKGNGKDMIIEETISLEDATDEAKMAIENYKKTANEKIDGYEKEFSSLKEREDTVVQYNEGINMIIGNSFTKEIKPFIEKLNPEDKGALELTKKRKELIRLSYDGNIPKEELYKLYDQFIIRLSLSN